MYEKLHAVGISEVSDLFTFLPAATRFFSSVSLYDTVENVPSLEEVRTAIGKLHNGQAAGLDDTSPELLKCAKEPISIAFHTLFTKV